MLSAANVKLALGLGVDHLNLALLLVVAVEAHLLTRAQTEQLICSPPGTATAQTKPLILPKLLDLDKARFHLRDLDEVRAKLLELVEVRIKLLDLDVVQTKLLFNHHLLHHHV